MDNKKFSGIFVPRASFYLWVIFILAVVITVLDWRVSVPCYLLLAALVYYNFRSNYVRQKEITKYIENLTLNIDTATKDTLLNFPMPLVVIELDGTIIWYNSSFRKIFEGQQLFERTIGSFAEELHPENLISDRTNISKETVINGRHYSVLGNIVKIDEKSSSNEYILLLYLIDNTELVEVRKLYRDERASIGIIIIDNYDDLMQSLEDSNRPQMLAEIEKKVAHWVGFTGGVLKKFERDKYLLIFEHKYLKEFENKKFDILDSVKEINLGNRIPVTLSLGLGINGKTMAENFHFAAASIDIALGRGGDQVVIKDGESFSFFGGKTREMEKRTRVKARVIAYALRELIEQSSGVMIMGHENVDIDVLGAAMGLYRIACGRKKDTNIVLEYSNPTIDAIMTKIQNDGEYENLFIGRAEALNKVNTRTLLIIVDTHRAAFTECPQLLNYTDQIVVIDHHRKGADFIQDAVLTYQETYASSTCEMVTEILQYVEENPGLRPLEVEALYAGIVIDTKNFTFKTGVRTFEAASYLRRQGVDTFTVKQLFQNDLKTYTSISNVVRDAEIINDRIALSVCASNVKSAQLIAAQAADQLLSLSGIAAAFVLSTAGATVFISGRSFGDINVQVILEKLGGGGHFTVAGTQIEGISVEEAKEKLKYAIINYIDSLSGSEKQ
ncbi:c-di-AMP phosphodiesterase-like protein [Anaerobacterium chartisolvens]|uniref:Cyclic-di-AMP phosphodiesterase n=1 Tax=Anaerobacterium chartisolvens TaxID=1297424 RepID=A0A369BHJ4_9FIRM|nr:DHH family phosphoesterase [Anaerobacterium chartisolvens]RCX21030.1 c-di-AMP phosphodiesterase-like protein [Anaerobacterium chartisolvens]